MTTITMSSPRLFAAATHFMGDGKDGRGYLHGVRLEPQDGGAYVVATNGHYMMVGFDPSVSGLEKDITIRPASGKALPVRWIGGEGDCVMDLEARTMRAGAMVEAIEWGMFDTYPDWRVMTRTLLADDRVPVKGFDTELLVTVGKVAKALTGSSMVGVRMTGETNPMVLRMADDAYAVVMPGRVEVPEVPEWLVERAAAPTHLRIAAE